MININTKYIRLFKKVTMGLDQISKLLKIYINAMIIIQSLL